MKRKMIAMLMMIVLVVTSIPITATTAFAENVNTATNEGKKVTSISLGFWRSAAVTTSGELYCWGYNEYGQIGNGTELTQFTSAKILGNVATILLRDNRSAAVTTDGKLYCWGSNYSGQIGNGTELDQSVPEKVLENVATVSLGASHSAAVTTNGELYCWGNNNYGQIGNGTTENQRTPVKVLENVATVSLGEDHSAAVTTSGELYCWGSNYWGQIGIDGVDQATPVKILENVATVSLGKTYSVAVTTDGDLYFWGVDISERTGNGNKKSTPEKLLENVATVSLGEGRSAAVTTNGDLYCWGSNRYGQIGNGTTENQLIPVKVLENVSTVSLGDSHSAAVTANGDLYCWGYNADGQIGNGTTENQLIPVKVLENVATVSLGQSHSAAVATNGRLYCWGDNVFGQIGIGNETIEEQLTPVQVLVRDVDDDSEDEDSSPETVKKPSTVPSYDKNITAKLDVSEYTKGVNLGKDTIHGPSLKIMGKEIELFSLDTQIKLKVGDNVTFSRDEKKKTVQVLVGVVSKDGKLDFSDDANSDRYWKETYSQVKSLYTGMRKGAKTKNLYNQFRSLRKKLHATDSTLLVKGKFDSVLFLEFSYATGELELTEGGGIISAELSADWEKRIPNFPLAYVTVGAKASGELTFNVIPAWSGELDVDLAVNAGVGIGEKKRAKTYIEGGAKVTLKNKVKLPASSIKNALSIKLNGKGYLKAKALGFNVADTSKDFLNMDIYPNFEIKTASILLTEDDMKQKLSPGNLEYTASLFALTDAGSAGLERAEVYPYCAPVLSDLGNGKYLLVWVDDLGDKDTYNRTTLVYSYYNGTAWSEPNVAAESNYLNDYPSVYAKDGTAYVLWQQATQSCDADTTLEEMLSYMDLYCMKFENGKMGTPFAVTEQNTVYEMLQQIYIAEDGVYAVWVENSNNDPFMGTEETNSIYCKELTTDSQKELVAEDLSAVENVLVGEMDDKLVVIYESEDVVYLYNGNTTVNLSGEDTITNVQFVGEELYALVNGYVSRYEDGSFVSLGLELSGDYTVLSDGDRIVSNVSTGGTSQIVMYSRLEDGWNEGVKLTDGTKYVRNYGLIEHTDGTLTGAVCEVNVDLELEDIYGSAVLYVDGLSAPKNIEILDTVYTDMENPVAGEETTFYYEVANNGEETVEEYTVTLTDAEGNILAQEDVVGDIQGGTTEEGSITVSLPEKMEKQDFTLSISTPGDNEEENNGITMTMGYGNLTISDSMLSEDGTVSGLLTNTGYDTLENVTLKVYKDSMDTEPIRELEYDALSVGAEQEILLILSEEEQQTEGALGTTLILEAETDSLEAGYGDNTETIFCYRELDLVLDSAAEVEQGSTTQLKMTDTLTGEDFRDKVLWSSGNEDIVTVTDMGMVQGVKAGSVNVYAWFEDTMYTCKVTVSPVTGTDKPKEEGGNGGSEGTPDDNITVTDAKTTGLKLTGISKKIAAGKKIALAPVFTPANASNKTLKWTSSNTKYATVNGKGVVTTKKKGAGKSVTITAITQDGSNVKATYKIAIMKHAVKSIKLTVKSKTVQAGKKLTLKATVKTTGKNANKVLQWTSSNTKYATVTKKGVVKTKKAGKGKTVKITAKATDGTNKKATIKIKIK